MIEIWKPVQIYNHKLSIGIWKYEISNLGRVRIPEYIDTKKRFHMREY